MSKQKSDTPPADHSSNDEFNTPSNQPNDEQISIDGEQNQATDNPPKSDDGNDTDDITQSQQHQSAAYKSAPKKPIFWILVGMLCAALLMLIGYGLLKSYQGGGPTAANTVNTTNGNSGKHDDGLVQTLKDKIAGKQIVTLQGEVHSETINVSTKLPSRIDTIYVAEGQAVKAGDLLIKLISPEIEAKKQQAAAMLQSALALQSSANRGTRQENVETLHANWQAAVAQADLAAKTAQRGDYLYQEGVISRQRRDEMQTANISANQLAQAAHQQYLKAVHGRTDEQKSSADAQVKIAQAAVQEADALDSETLLHAPADGTVNKIYTKPSELAMPAIPVLSLLDAKTSVKLVVREDYYASIHQHSSLSGYIPALNRTADFRIIATDSEGEFATIKSTRQSGGYDIKSFTLTLEPIDAIAGLKAGMSVVFDVQIDTINQP
ncbi:HlyD family secretion protein [Moraxella marmotae]|uniref:HlyD family secretion protein n=1 Tax=Moraxella marmotae TaxID=3344520 RepID=UPI0035F32209